MDEIEITLAENGFVLEYADPAISEANSKEGAKWKDPKVERVYTTQQALLKDLGALLPTMAKAKTTKADEYNSAFNEAIAESD